MHDFKYEVGSAKFEGNTMHDFKSEVRSAKSEGNTKDQEANKNTKSIKATGIAERNSTTGRWH